jgi:2-polyprenyl-6-methoxyphenol hydroxylase-like FAD-dependent oxidoreductase
MRVLAGLGLADTIIRRDNGIETPWISMYDSSGSLLGTVPHGTKEQYGYPSLMTTRLDIHEVLLEDAEKRGIEVRYGAKVTALHELEGGVVVHWLEDTGDKELKVDLVVGADGIWSVVRQRQARNIARANHFGLIIAASRCAIQYFQRI